mmetsp:Transcript_22065/g.89485  ORF Transcript_22065/g.89485 Transcript_22065/m.89485 type:complete len:82 (+) Transcript_22065:245-490(+)
MFARRSDQDFSWEVSPGLAPEFGSRSSISKKGPFDIVLRIFDYVHVYGAEEPSRSTVLRFVFSAVVALNPRVFSPAFMIMT